MYSQITSEQEKEIKKQLKFQLSMKNNDPCHISACIARTVLCKRKTEGAINKAWNSKVGSDAYAAVLTYLVHNKFFNVYVPLVGYKE